MHVLADGANYFFVRIGVCVFGVAQTGFFRLHLELAAEGRDHEASGHYVRSGYPATLNSATQRDITV